MSNINDIWINLGKKSFARFYALDMEEVQTMISNPNSTFYDMLSEMDVSLNDYEDFMVKIKKVDIKKGISRVDILDL